MPPTTTVCSITASLRSLSRSFLGSVHWALYLIALLAVFFALPNKANQELENP
jgi:hypothetical protein